MFAAVGEALVDLIEHEGGLYEPCLGGSVCNFTRAMALQGQRIRYLNPLSNDTFGDRFAQRLQADGVDLGQAPRSACPTSLAVVSLGPGGSPLYTFHRQHVADRDGRADDLIARLPEALRLIHTGGLALVPGDWPKTQAVLAAARARGALVSVDANLRLLVVGPSPAEAARYRQAVQEAMAMADIVKLSDEDLVALGWQERGMDAVAQHLFEHTRTQLVAFTLGGDGAMLCTRSASVQLPIPGQVTVKDTVGAGDCFQAGLLAWLAHASQMRNETLRDLTADDLTVALRHAMAAAAINVQRQGCQPAGWDETRQWLGA